MRGVFDFGVRLAIASGSFRGEVGEMRKAARPVWRSRLSRDGLGGCVRGGSGLGRGGISIVGGGSGFGSFGGGLISGG